MERTDSEVLTCRLPADLVKRIRYSAELNGATISMTIRKAVEEKYASTVNVAPDEPANDNAPAPITYVEERPW